MKQKSRNLLLIKKSSNDIKVSFGGLQRLTILNSETIRLALLDIVTNKNSELEIDLTGVLFIDSSIVDIFNLLSRMAHRYNSRVILTNVSTEVFELIELVKLHSIFDIKHVLPIQESRSVA